MTKNTMAYCRGHTKRAANAAGNGACRDACRRTPLRAAGTDTLLPSTRCESVGAIAAEATLEAHEAADTPSP